MKEGLKPCPFCGGEVEMQYTGSSDWEVSCRTCPVETKFWVSAQKHGYGEGERQEAMRRWNQRSSEAEQKEQKEVWAVKGKTTFILFKTEKAAHSYISSFSASVGGGMSITRLDVFDAEPSPPRSESE